MHFIFQVLALCPNFTGEGSREPFALKRRSLGTPAWEGGGVQLTRPGGAHWAAYELRGGPSGETCALQGVKFALRRISIMF